MEGFLNHRRPRKEIRHELDINYKIEGQSIIIYEVRPDWKDKEVITETPVAKTTWMQSKKVWKIFWMRGDLKWHAYTPKPQVKTLEEFLEEVGKDPLHCFWG